MRIGFIILFIIAFLALLISKVYFLSIKSNEYYEEIAKRNIVKKEYLSPTRGLIKDRNGYALAVNKLGFSIAVKPHLRYKSKIPILEKELRFISQTLALDYEKLKKNYYKYDSPYNHEFVKVVDFIAYNEVLPHFVKLTFDHNIEVKPASKRFYPFNELASHLIGYVGRANVKDHKENEVSKHTNYVGRSGVENYYNHQLQGELGFKNTKVTARNEKLKVLEKKLPASKDLTLTLDLQLQKYISDIFEGISGVAIVMDAHSGEIYAAGSFPEYDLNTFVGGISVREWKMLINDPSNPFTNKISSGLYPPGSVIKMGMAMAFLDSKKVDPYTRVFCSGKIELGRRNFRCWKKYGHGSVGLRKAIRESCDVYFYNGSLKVGIKKISSYLNGLGLGVKSGIDIPNEFRGVVPNREWKLKRYKQPWYLGETVNASIGQGYFSITPIQIARHTALLATGKLVQPHLAKMIGEEYLEYAHTKPIEKFNRSALATIREAMNDVCNDPKGTASRYIDTDVEVAGKTGTAQVVGIRQDIKKRMKEEDIEYFRRSHAWLTTYAPYKDPKFVVTVLVEHGGHGGSAAGPIVSKIYNKLKEMKYIR
jgi:penicillin-binding protein 2